MKNLAAMQETPEMWVQYLGWKDSLEEDAETHSSILAWKIPRTEELGGLQCVGRKELDTTEVTEHNTALGNPSQEAPDSTEES